jgi:hypothetical protein
MTMPKSKGSYIIEFIPQGRYVKVTAVDPVTGIEAVIVGDAAQSQQTLERTAVQKLEFLLAKSAQ